jgi:hypothetical protein
MTADWAKLALTLSPETESNAVCPEYPVAETLTLCFRQTEKREKAIADTSLN